MRFLLKVLWALQVRIHRLALFAIGGLLLGLGAVLLLLSQQQRRDTGNSALIPLRPTPRHHHGHRSPRHPHRHHRPDRRRRGPRPAPRTAAPRP